MSPFPHPGTNNKRARMSAQPPLDNEQLIQRIRRDLVDSWDEEIEMDVEDYHPLPGCRMAAPMAPARRTIGATISSSCFACRPSS